MPAVSWVTAGDFLRSKFLGCLELSCDRLEGAEDALMELVEAIPDPSLTLEFPDRALLARVCFQA